MDGQNLLSRTIRAFLGLALLSLAVAGTGCGGGSGGKGSSKVSGTVMYQGKPVPTGTVTFFDEKKDIVGSASISNGSYTAEGLPIGKAVVTVTTPPEVKPDPKHPQPKDRPGDPPLSVVPIPAQYGNPQNSGLNCDVKPGSQEFPIALH